MQLSGGQTDLISNFSNMRIDSELTNPQKVNQSTNLNSNDPFLYIHRENQALIHTYGPDHYDYAKELETSSQLPANFMHKHKIEPHIRTKMIDWMVEVHYAYNSDASTLFLAIHLMDLFHAKSKISFSNSDIHLTGITCIYIASKMEDIVPLRMSHVKNKIAHGKFSDKEIRRREKLILETIDFSIIAASTYDFVKTFIYDFCHNNREYINQLEMHAHIDAFDNICIFLAKMIMHFEEFSPFKYSLKAIACIVAAFDILRSNSQNLSKDAENFMRQWVKFLIFNLICLDFIFD
jgi:hypothetical protein